MRLFRIALACAALALAGCSATVTPLPPITGNPTADSVAWDKFTQADLAHAEADAKASGDVIAEPCYPAIADMLQSLPVNQAQQCTGADCPVTGVATLFQQARDVYNPLRGGIPAGLVVGCGPLASQLRMDLLQLLAKLAAGTAVGVLSGGIAVTPMLVQ